MRRMPMAPQAGIPDSSTQSLTCGFKGPYKYRMASCEFHRVRIKGVGVTTALSLLATGCICDSLVDSPVLPCAVGIPKLLWNLQLTY